MTESNGKITIVIRKLTQPSCGPCKALDYGLASIKQELAENNAVITEHDVTVEKALVTRYDIHSTPVLIFERNGAEITRLNGMVSAQEVIDAVEYAKVAP